MPKIVDLGGQRFGKLLVMCSVGSDKRGNRLWECRCDCGGATKVTTSNLRRGHSRSCGCGKGKNPNPKTKHGKHDSPIYDIWTAMKQRCLNPNCDAYRNYGGRGITLCKSWHQFENFYADMGDPPNGLTLDRIDNDGNYEVNNCRWVSRKRQQRNMRTSVKVEYEGKSVLLADLFDRLALPGLKYNTVHQRIHNGWPVQKALETEAQRRSRCQRN